MSTRVPLEALRSRMETESGRLTHEIDQLSARIMQYSNRLHRNTSTFAASPEQLQDYLKLLGETALLKQKHARLLTLRDKIETHIIAVSDMIERGDIPFDRFPVFPDIELAEHLARLGNMEAEKAPTPLYQ